MIHWETCVSIIVLLCANWRGGTTEKIYSITKYKSVMINILI